MEHHESIEFVIALSKAEDKMKQANYLSEMVDNAGIRKIYDNQSWFFRSLIEGIESLQKENEELKSRLEKSVELPCKVGDTVYDMKYGEVNAWKITLISHWGNEIHINSECKVFLPCDFGKTVFLTRKEAEKALKERENNA